MSEAIEITPAYFKGKFPIEAYGAGGFRFADSLHKGGLLCSPSGFYSVELASNIIVADNLTQIIELKNEIEFLLIGTGTKIQPVSLEAKKMLQKHNIGFDIMNTGAAVRTYNILLSENRNAAALLYPI